MKKDKRVVWVVHKNANIYGVFTSKERAREAENKASYGLGCEGFMDTRVSVTRATIE